MKFRQQIRSLTNVLNKKQEQVQACEEIIRKKDEIIRSQEEWIERLLVYAELSKEELQKMLGREKQQAKLQEHIATTLGFFGTVGRGWSDGRK